jgi:hypothetical protein
MVHLSETPEEITNRTFGVHVQVIADLFISEPVPMRVILLSKNEQVGQAGLAFDADFDEGSGILRVPPGGVARVGVMLTRTDVESLRVVVQDPTTDTVLDQSGEIPVNLVDRS